MTSSNRASLCITCGLDAGPSSTLNRLQDGRTCPTCCERMLDSLPPPFPGFAYPMDSRPGRRSAVPALASKPMFSVLRKTRRGRKDDAK